MYFTEILYRKLIKRINGIKYEMTRKKEIMKRNSYYCAYIGKISKLNCQSFIGIDIDNEIIDKRKKS